MKASIYPTNLQAPMVRDPDTGRMVLVLSVFQNPYGVHLLQAIEPCDGKPRCNGQEKPFFLIDRFTPYDNANDISSLLVEPATVYRPVVDPDDLRPLLVEG